MVLLLVLWPLSNFAPTRILFREFTSTVMLLNIEYFHLFRLQILKVLLLILIQTNGRIILKSIVQFYLYSILNQRDKLFREKMSTKYYFWKERKVFRCHKERKSFPVLYCCYLSIKSEPTRRFNWKNSLKVLNDFFPVGQKIEKLLLF